MFLGIIRNKPVHDTQGNIRGAVDDRQHLVHILSIILVIETEDFVKKEVILGVIKTIGMNEKRNTCGGCGGRTV